MNKIEKAKNEILLTDAFFSRLLMRLQFVNDDSIQFASTDGKCVKYNAEALNVLAFDEVVTIIMHEILHCALSHHLRLSEWMNMQKANIACDHAVNLLLKQYGRKIPDNWYCDDQYIGLSFEEIYNRLPDDCDKNKQQPSSGVVQSGNTDDDGNAMTESEKQQAEQEWKNATVDALNKAEQYGKVGSDFSRAIKEQLKSEVDWRSALNRFAIERCNDDYTFLVPNRKYDGGSIIMPALQNMKVKPFVIVCDESGSISDEMNDQFASEIQSIADVTGAKIYVLYVDAAICGIEEFEHGDIIKLNPKGGGGTDFRPAFDWVEKELDNDIAGMIYFTDLYGEFPSSAPEYDVLWAVIGRKLDTPFGEVIKVK